MVETANGTVCIGADTIALNNGVGTYSLSAFPGVISAVGEEKYIEIFVYTDDKRVQLVTRLYVRPVLFEF